MAEAMAYKHVAALRLGASWGSCILDTIWLAIAVCVQPIAPQHMPTAPINCAGIYPGEMDGQHKAGFAPYG